MKRTLLSLGIAAVALAAIGPAEAMARKGSKLIVRDSEYGKVLMNGGGKALYLFTKEKGRTPQCYGDCAVAWPPYVAKGKPVAGKRVDAKLLGTTKRTDGSRQVTYKGHPLYFYVHDSPGNIYCQDVFEFGGYWLLLDGLGKAVRSG